MVPLALLVTGLLAQAGSEPLPALDSRIPRAEWLIAESGCLACHLASPEVTARLQPRLAPTLEGLGRRTRTTWLAEFLDTPSLHGPAPDLTSALDPAERTALLHYLRRDDPASEGDGEAPSVHFAAELERGRKLFHTIGCVACHEPFEEAWEQDLPYWFRQEDLAPREQVPEPGDARRHVPSGTFAPLSVPLASLDQRHTVASLTGYLLDPLSLDPDGRMPGFDLTSREAGDLAVYLLRDGALAGRRVFEGSPGLAFERYDDVSASELPDFDALEPALRGVALDLDSLPEHPDDHFGLRFLGVIDIPHAGAWTFTLNSDDGSRLELDGQVLVDNDGLHGTTSVSGTRELEAGPHALRIEYWEESGGEVLELTWAGPQVSEGPVPASALRHAALAYRGADVTPVDEPLAQRGREVYVRLGCGACHDQPPASAATRPPRLARLPEHLENRAAAAAAGADGDGVAADDSCLSVAPRPGLPRYDLSDADRAQLRGLVGRRDAFATPVDPARRLERSLARNACYACHRRDDLGGPHPTRADYFRPSGNFDLGEEGRIPPHLTATGAKLLPEALDAVLAGDRRVRPYVATRMPRFGERLTEPLVQLFAEVDGELEWNPPATDASPAELRRIGRQLVGTENGLGCIQCHRFQEVPSLGIQAVDLMQVEDRLQAGWFAQLLLDPQAVRMNTRMPSFWEQGRSPVDVLGRDPAAQTAAILAYLAQGQSAPHPPGLVTPDSVYELDTDEGTRLVSVFMKDVSPRTQLVGSPLGVHMAFDVEHSRLAWVWTGRFFNAKGTWQGRAGALETPPGRSAIPLPPGATVALLPAADAAWPETAPERLGQRYDAQRRPVFRYRVGTTSVAEHSEVFEDPASGRPGLRRRFELSAPAPEEQLFLRLHDDAGRASFDLRVVEPETWPAPPGPVTVERTRAGRRERLLLPRWNPAPEGFAATIELEYTW